MKTNNIELSIKNSALWSAYGDALGFISERVDRVGLKRRIRNDRVNKTIEWKRLIGGRFGAEVTLPAGCYSDDTQLRLSTSRSIRGNGEFDVEAFAKVELPVWLSYALGAGKGTKTAASMFRRNDVNWFSNFFDQEGSRYVDAGGNGAAMRIQPHVWAASERGKPETYILDVIKNSICTHGNPRGILGSVFHAICLGNVIEYRVVPEPESWSQIIYKFKEVLDLIRGKNDLRDLWLSVYEEKTAKSIEDNFKSVELEILDDIKIIMPLLSEKSELGYRRIVESIGGLTEEHRGSGIKTSISALALSWMFREEDPSVAIEIASNLLNSDTDTIASMTGAILGSLNANPPEQEIMDRAYIEAEASRLYKISTGQIGDKFSYPDLMKWQPPKSQLDVVGKCGSRMCVAGLAFADEGGNIIEGRGKDGSAWQIMKLSIGQTIIAKRRVHLREINPSNIPAIKVDNIKIKNNYIERVTFKGPITQQPNLFVTNNIIGYNEKIQKKDKNIDEMTREAIKQGFDKSIIGRHIIELAEQPDGIEKAIAYVSIIAKAIISRSKQQK